MLERHSKLLKIGCAVSPMLRSSTDGNGNTHIDGYGDQPTYVMYFAVMPFDIVILPFYGLIIGCRLLLMSKNQRQQYLMNRHQKRSPAVVDDTEKNRFCQSIKIKSDQIN